MGQSLHKSYVLNATYLALSLSKELGRQFRHQEEQEQQLESANGDNNVDEKLEEEEEKLDEKCCSCCRRSNAKTIEKYKKQLEDLREQCSELKEWYLGNEV